MITEQLLDKSLQAISSNNHIEIINLAIQIYRIDINGYKNKIDLIKKFEELLMKDIEESRELTIFFRKVAKLDGKYDGGLWDFIINNSTDNRSLKIYIQNHWKYCKNETDLKKNEKALIEKIKKVADLEVLTYCINNQLIRNSEIEDIIREMDDINYTNWLIIHRKEYENQISLECLISIASSKVGIKYYIENFEKYKFSPQEISIIALLAKLQEDSDIPEHIIKNRSKYKFNEFDTIQFIDALGIEEIKRHLNNINRYNFSNYEIASLVSLTKDANYIKQWLEENASLYDFSDEELFIMILASNDKEKIQNFIRAKSEKSPDFIKITVPDMMSVGIEIESEGKNSYVIMQLQELIKNWKSKEDISLDNGVEVISPKLKEDKSEEELYHVCEILSNAGQEATGNCGAHIHIGADYLTSTQSYRNLIDLWTNTERIMYLISNKASELPREGIELYAPPISNVIKQAMTEGNVDLYNEEDLEEFTKKLAEIQAYGKKSSSRMIKSSYYGINFRNINNPHKNTIEFRLANGTIDPEVIIKNINLFGGMVKIAEELTYIQSLDETDRTEKQKEKLKMFDFIVNSDTDNELLKVEALLYLVVEDDIDYYLKRYLTNVKLLGENGVAIKQIIDGATKKGTQLSNKYLKKSGGGTSGYNRDEIKHIKMQEANDSNER